MSPAVPRVGLIAVGLLAVAAAAFAQAPPDPHDAQPERPTVATHAGTVAPGWVEVEAGAEFDRYAAGDRGASTPIVAKFGLAPRVQLSVFESTVDAPGGELGVGDAAVGVKWRLADHAPILGRFAVLPILKLPTGSVARGAGTGTTDATLILISSHNVGPVALDLNAGYTQRSGDGTTVPRHSTVWTASLGGPFSGALGWAAEIYGYPKTHGPVGQANIVAVLAGPTWTARGWLVIDAGLIAPITGPQPRAIYFGATWNIGRLH